MSLHVNILHIVNDISKCFYYTGFIIKVNFFDIYILHLLIFSTYNPLQWRKVIFDPSSFAKCSKTATIFLLLLALAVGNIFRYLKHATILSFLTCPMVSYMCCQITRDYFVIYWYTEFSIYEPIIKLPIQLSAGGMSYCKIVCVI